MHMRQIRPVICNKKRKKNQDVNDILVLRGDCMYNPHHEIGRKCL